MFKYSLLKRPVILLIGCILLLPVTSPADEIPQELLDILQRQREEFPRKLYYPDSTPPAVTSPLYKVAIPSPRTDNKTHTIGNLRLTRTNYGQFQRGFFPGTTGETYLTVGGLWVGAVVGRDTLVSTATDDLGIQEFWPDENDTVIQRSINTNDKFFSTDAISEQDFVATYFDTLTHQFFVRQDPIDNRVHRPLNLKIVERTMQWSYDYAADFVIFDYSITNIGLRTLTDTYIGIYVDAAAYFTSNSLDPALISQGGISSGSDRDDIVGMMLTYPAECDFLDTLNTSYVLDNDGDPNDPLNWNAAFSLRNISGMRVLRKPTNTSGVSFNWWINEVQRFDFGPRKKGTEERPLRDMNGFLGTPYGDRNKYSIMSNDEIDYDQQLMALDHQGDGWLPPPPLAAPQSMGAPVRYLLSVGPFDLRPGQSAPFTFAYVAGRKVHVKPDNFTKLFDPFEPEIFIEKLDFSDFALNARWAGWVYDNPGVDTDRNGYRGKSRDCVFSYKFVIETTLVIDSTFNPPDTQLSIDTSVAPDIIDRKFYEGDGVPDFRGASPPPAPVVRVIPDEGRLTIQWNGYDSETTPDPFTGLVDFEGYRVYSSLTNFPDAFSLQTSFDAENFNRYLLDRARGEFFLPDPPFTIAELRALYGQRFDPSDYDISNPLVTTDPESGEDQTYYFATMDWNQYQLGLPNGIRKRFPDALKPPFEKALWTADDLTEDGLPKYYEYEFILDNLLSSIPLYVSVTAFDYGSPSVNLPSLETNPTLNSVREYPFVAAQEAQKQGLPVVVYPNPYRIDGNYRENGFEGRGMAGFPVERTRQVNFINLPLVCTISIYSLDGDLVRQVLHDRADGGAEATHDSWDVISRNLLPVVSGIYYWVVETPEGETQMGKIVLIL
jgi:hypothetical protein